MKKHNKAFTFVELIVVIVIITILGTIAYMSILDYSKNSRNSVRALDISQIRQSLGIFEVETGKYPLPVTYTGVTYDGGLLWYQGRYDNQVYRSLDNLSKKSVDPKFLIEYDYSVINNKTKYQIGTIMEGTFFGLGSQILNQANAISENDASTYVSGDYDLFDINSKSGSLCRLITAPSLFVNNFTPPGVLLAGGDYGFVHDGSNNFTQTYIPLIDDLSPSNLFTISEVLSDCQINTLDELNLYISKLAIAFQQLNGNNDFNEIIFNFNNNPFKQGMLDKLTNNGISLNPNLIKQLQNPTDGNIFNDFFTSTNGTELVNGYIPDSFGEWTRTGSLLNSSYIISGNQLEKADGNTGVIFPVPVLPITSRDKTILFTLKNFGGGSIFIYSKYIDENNRMGVELNSSGYSLLNIEGGLPVAGYPITSVDSISVDSQIELNITGNNIRLTVANIEKENIVDSISDLSGSPAIDIVSAGGIIDDFTLIYK